MAAERLDNEVFQELPTKNAARGFLPILWQRKALVLLGLVLGLGGGFLFYLQREPVYQAQSSMLVMSKQPPPIGPNAFNQMPQQDDTSTQLHVIRSPRVIGRAIEKNHLKSLKTFEDGSDPMSVILTSLAANRDVKEPNNKVIFLTYRGPIPDECGKILDAVIDSYKEFLEKDMRSAKDEMHESISKAREFLKKDIAEIEAKRKEFNEKTPSLYTGKGSVAVVDERINEIEKDITKTDFYLRNISRSIDNLEDAIKKGTGTEEMTNQQNEEKKEIAREKAAEKTLLEQLLQLQLLEKKLVGTYGENHPQVLEVRASMEMIKEFHKKTQGLDAEITPIKTTPAKYLGDLKRRQRDFKMQLEALNVFVKEQRSISRELRGYYDEDQKLFNEAAGANQLLDVALKSLKQININREDTGFIVRVLWPPGPGAKVAPSAFQTIVGGSMLGLLLGIGLAFLADFTDKGFRSPDDVRVHLQLQLLGHVPFLKPDPDVEKKVKAGEIDIDPLLCALFRSKSLESEAYRAIRTALMFSVQGQGHRVLQVTSPSKGDGKSLTLANLAISIAQAEKKVLIIDADCRRPRQHKIFNLPNTQGLVNVIRQDMPWQSCVQKTPAEGLWVMSSGPIPQNPAELLTSPQFKIFLEEARKEFDIVLVDSPPLLAVTDPCIVSSKVDGVVLVLRLSRQGRPNAERACEIMKQLKVNVLGLVVNGVTRQGGGIYSSEHYDYAESYTENESVSQEDDYYYYEEGNEPEKADVKAVPDKAAGPGVWGRLFNRK